MLKLFIVGGKELVRVSLPPEQNEYGHCTLLPGLLGCVRHLPLNHHRHDAIEEGVAHPSRAYSPECVEIEFCELRLLGILGSTYGPGPMLITPTDALWALLKRTLRREATGAAGPSTFREQNADKSRNAVPAFGLRRPERAETLANGSPPGPWRPCASGGRSWSVSDAARPSRCCSSVCASGGRC